MADDETESPKPARRAMRAERTPEPDQVAALTAERDALAAQVADLQRAVKALSQR